MGEEDRGSGSGSSTLMIVLAILAGILILGCCGGVVAVGLGGFVLVRSQPVPAPPQVIMQSAPTSPDVQEALDKVQEDLQPLKVPEPVEGPQPPPVGDAPPAFPETKDE